MAPRLQTPPPKSLKYTISKSYGALPTSDPTFKFNLYLEDQSVPNFHVPEVPPELLAKTQAAALLYTKEETLADPHFVSTYHPALRGRCARLKRYLNGNIHHNHPDEAKTGRDPIWLLYSADPIGHVAAGGLAIQVQPKMEYVGSHPHGIVFTSDPYRHPLDPCGFLTDADINRFMEMFPKACGFRLLRCGVLVMVFPRKKDMEVREEYWKYPYEIGGLLVAFDSMDQCRYEISDTEPEMTIQLEDGTKGSVLPTHTLVKLNQTWKESVVGAVDGAVNSFRRVIGSSSYSPPSRYPSLGAPLSNSTDKTLRTITHLFDPPSPHLTFPTDFLHNLTLISPPLTTPVTPSPTNLNLTGFADLSEYNTTTYAADLSPPSQTDIVLQGTEYFVNQTTRQVGVALLWRTTGSHEEAGHTKVCVGTPEGEDLQVVCFKSAKVHLRMAREDGVEGERATSYRMGFLLPEVVRSGRVVG
ncbi:hypothetical protein BJ508DRAFT_380743 [Ascobolus immersus RN42]|uniref:Uncharacterized protein n=1 Tax=Ascobolus immersus RN42 TaxID=1160509 RepID=A0A3N4HJT7_ASCIM|nr:hypothetical protein BJ508DRAFT_380743 [Ascobolus immersus RN42]